MRKIVTLFLIATFVAMLAACSSNAAVTTAIGPTVPASKSTAAAGAAVSTRQVLATPASPIVVEYDQDDLVVSTPQANVSTVKLAGDTITFAGKGAAVKGNVLTISAAGA